MDPLYSKGLVKIARGSDWMEREPLAERREVAGVRGIAEETLINNRGGVAYCMGLQSPIARLAIFAYQPSNKTRWPFHRCLYTHGVSSYRDVGTRSVAGSVFWSPC